MQTVASLPIKFESNVSIARRMTNQTLRSAAFAKWLVAKREAARMPNGRPMTVRHLSDISGVSASMISSVENGATGVSARRVEMLATALGADANEALELAGFAPVKSLSAVEERKSRLAKLGEVLRDDQVTLLEQLGWKLAEPFLLQSPSELTDDPEKETQTGS
jgi:hypothetical protein